MNIAIMGAGAVGQSVLELAEPYGHTVTGIADSTSAAVEPAGLDPDSVLERKHSEGVVGSDAVERALEAEYDVLVEATPTTLGDAEPGFGNARRALERDCDVVLANKGPVAERYEELRTLERDSEGTVRFEATVGGAIPVIGTIEDIGAAHIDEVRGVLNGTANFILSRMAAEGLEYEHALAEAQDIGVAEADPTFDVNGTDAALKCVIVANIITDQSFTLDDAVVTGIQDLPASALDLAQEDGSTIRLVGEISDGSVRVGPRLVGRNAPLSVTGTQNIVQFETARAGTLAISGRGAGGDETATAIMGDIRRLER
jgi:homoserine dehydrogenase